MQLKLSFITFGKPQTLLFKTAGIAATVVTKLWQSLESAESHCKLSHFFCTCEELVIR